MLPSTTLCPLRTLRFILPALSLASLAHAQRDLTDIPPPDPELEQQSFVLPEGFEISLFAADPEIAKPIQMNFDPQGRLWIAGSTTYPQVAPGDEADDRILILEDADGDGVSDSTTVFARGLLIPTGVVPGDGGAYVANSTELLHLADTDGDGQADSSRVVLSGFGTEDTHHILHTFRWGPAQRLHMLQSIYIHSHVETPYGVKRLNAGGIWQFRPDTWELDVFARGWVNPWGLHWLPYGQAFVTDGAGGEGINYAVPDASYTTAYGADRMLPGLNPGSPKHCGLEVVSGRHLPEDWQHSLITCDFRGHRVCRFTLTERGSGYVSQEQQEVIKSDHLAFRPVDVKMGPDGAIYIADWYNPIIQHGEVDFRDPRRDHTHGRIWRVTYSGNDLLERPNLVEMSDAELCQQLAAPEMWTREQAQRLLKERGPDVLPAVRRWAQSIDNSSPDYYQQRLQALWGYLSHRGRSDFSAIGLADRFDAAPKSRSVPSSFGDDRSPASEDSPRSVHPSFSQVAVSARGDQPARMSGVPFEVELLHSLLRSDDHNARAAATRVIGDWHERLDDPLALLEVLAGDEHPRVRLEAVCVLRKIPELRAIEVAMRALDPTIDPQSARDAWQLSDPKLADPAPTPEVDEWLDYALWQTARELQPVWQPALLAGDIDFGGDTRRLAYVLKAAGSAETVPLLTRLLREGAIPEDERADAVSVIGQHAGPPQLAELLDLAVTIDNTTLKAACLKTLLETHDTRSLTPAGELESLADLFTSDDERVRALVVRCAGAWNVSKLRDDVEVLVGDESAPPSIRDAAVWGVASYGGNAAASLLIETAAEENPAYLRQAASVALLGLRQDAGVAAAIELMQDVDDASVLQPLFSAFLSRKRALERLTKDLDGETVPSDVAVVGLRAIGSSGQELPEFAAALQKAGNVASGPKKLSPDEMQAMIAEVEAHGDPALGEAIYRRRDLNCLKCHAIGGAAGKVGPDMLSLGATAQLDYIIDALLDPNKQVKENYYTMIVLDDEGRTYSGIVVRQSDEEVVLRDADGREQTVKLATVEEMKQGVSLMPAGLTDKLTQRELVHLVAFLKALGRLPEYTIGKEPVVREWEIMQPTEEAEYRLRRVSYAVAATDDPAFTWVPSSSTVSGVLPLGELPALRIEYRTPPEGPGVAFARTYIHSDGSPVTLKFNDVTGLTAWWDDQPLELAEQTAIDASAGRHRLTFAVDLAAAAEELRIER